MSHRTSREARITPKAKHDVFISYDHDDKVDMEDIKRALENEGLRIWVDHIGLPPGTPGWQKTIETAIEEAHCVLVILSPSAKESEWVGDEIAYAKSRSKDLIPVLVRGSEKDAIPIALISHQYADIQNDKTRKKELQKLAQNMCDAFGIESTWKRFTNQFKRGQLVNVTVTTVTDFGAFAELRDIPVEGLIHISELDSPHQRAPRKK